MAPETPAPATNDELHVQQAEIHAGPFAHVSDQARLEAATAMRSVMGFSGASETGGDSQPRLLQTANETHWSAAVESGSLSDGESDSDSDSAPQTLVQELAKRMNHAEDVSARAPEERGWSSEQTRNETPLKGEFYSEEGMMARMELLEKESIKQALEDLWTAANCVDPTDEIIDKQELTLAPSPDQGPDPSPNPCPRWSTRQGPSPNP